MAFVKPVRLYQFFDKDLINRWPGSKGVSSPSAVVSALTTGFCCNKWVVCRRQSNLMKLCWTRPTNWRRRKHAICRRSLRRHCAIKSPASRWFRSSRLFVSPPWADKGFNPKLPAMARANPHSGQPFGISDHAFSGFLRVVTHPRIFTTPSSISSALEFARQVREQLNCQIITPGLRWGNPVTGKVYK